MQQVEMKIGTTLRLQILKNIQNSKIFIFSCKSNSRIAVHPLVCPSLTAQNAYCLSKLCLLIIMPIDHKAYELSDLLMQLLVQVSEPRMLSYFEPTFLYNILRFYSICVFQNQPARWHCCSQVTLTVHKEFQSPLSFSVAKSYEFKKRLK